MRYYVLLVSRSVYHDSFGTIGDISVFISSSYEDSKQVQNRDLITIVGSIIFIIAIFAGQNYLLGRMPDNRRIL